MIDYTIFYKESYTPDSDWATRETWDLFFSAYNSSDRVSHVFDEISAVRKIWLVHEEYGYDENDIPSKDYFLSTGRSEAEFVIKFFEHLNISNISERHICIDATGFMRPTLMFLLLYIKHLGFKKLDVIYSEPNRYIKKEKTTFSDEIVTEVRQVAGFEGMHSVEDSNDILIIGAGYDHTLIKQVAEHKENARKIQMFGFPSLSADMYQENVLRAQKASESVGGAPGGANPDNYFSPANDPFVTADVLRNIVNRISSLRPITNLYLCPIGTKAQTIGFTLYYLTERRGGPTSIIFPFFEKYTRKTSTGIERVWKYTVEFL